MKRLTHREMQALLDGVLELHSSLDAENLPARIFAAIKRVVSIEITAIDGFDLQGNWSGESWCSPADSLTLEEVAVFAYYAAEHPLFQEYSRNGLPAPRKISDFATERQFHSTNIYNEFYRRVGVERQMVFGVPTSAARMMLVALNRSRKDFTETDRQLLQALRTHLIAAYRNTAAFAQLQTAIGELSGAIIVLATDGRVRFITDRARALLAEYFAAPHGRADELPDELVRWLAHRARRAHQNGEVEPPATQLEVVRAEGRLRVRLLVDNVAGQKMLVLEEERTEVSAKELESLGLTKREAEVLAWVAQGKTNAEIALLCDLSARTVQKHLEHIYQKLGVETRLAATRRALETFARS